MSSKFQLAKKAILSGDIDALKNQLSKNSFLIHERDENGKNTLLHIASGMGKMSYPENNPEIVRLLIIHGADIEAKEEKEFGERPLHHAVSAGNIEMTKILVEEGADLEARGRHNTEIDTVLGYALFYGTDKRIENQQDIFDYLINAGSDFKPQFVAAIGNVDELDEALLNYRLTKKTLQECLLFACKYGNEKNCEYLLDRKVNVIPFFHYTATGLHLACETAYGISCVLLLMERKADLSIRDDSFKATALEWAQYCNQYETLSILNDHIN